MGSQRGHGDPDRGLLVSAASRGNPFRRVSPRVVRCAGSIVSSPSFGALAGGVGIATSAVFGPHRPPTAASAWAEEGTGV